MGELLLFITAMIISVCYDIMKPQQMVQLDNIGESEHIKTAEIRTADIIKRRLIYLYNSNATDKRERIVNLLIQLERLEDPDSFFDKYDHIRSYIFDMTYT